MRGRPLTTSDKQAIKALALAYEGYMFWVEQLQARPEANKIAKLQNIALNGQALYERQRELSVVLIIDVRAALNKLGIPADENCCAYGAKPTPLPEVKGPGRRAALTPEQAQMAKDMYYRDDLSLGRVAKFLGVSHRTIANVIERKPPYDNPGETA